MWGTDGDGEVLRTATSTCAHGHFHVRTSCCMPSAVLHLNRHTRHNRCLPKTRACPPHAFAHPRGAHLNTRTACLTTARCHLHQHLPSQPLPECVHTCQKAHLDACLPAPICVHVCCSALAHLLQFPPHDTCTQLPCLWAISGIQDGVCNVPLSMSRQCSVE